MNPIGRIVDYHTGWAWFQMDDAGEIEAGDWIRATPYADSKQMRLGAAKVIGRMGHALYFAEPVHHQIAALCDMDYVYLYREAG